MLSAQDNSASNIEFFKLFLEKLIQDKSSNLEFVLIADNAINQAGKVAKGEMELAQVDIEFFTVVVFLLSADKDYFASLKQEQSFSTRIYKSVLSRINKKLEKELEKEKKELALFR